MKSKAKVVVVGGGDTSSIGLAHRIAARMDGRYNLCSGVFSSNKTKSRNIAKKLGKLIQTNMGIKVIYTRDEDVFIPLWKRTKIANDSGGKVFISIHANSAPGSPSVRGFETYLLRPGKTKDAIEVAQRENEVIGMEEQYHKYEELSNDKLILYTMAQSSFMKESEFLEAREIMAALENEYQEVGKEYGSGNESGSEEEGDEHSAQCL